MRHHDAAAQEIRAPRRDQRQLAALLRELADDIEAEREAQAVARRAASPPTPAVEDHAALKAMVDTLFGALSALAGTVRDGHLRQMSRADETQARLDGLSAELDHVLERLDALEGALEARAAGRSARHMPAEELSATEEPGAAWRDRAAANDTADPPGHPLDLGVARRLRAIEQQLDAYLSRKEPASPRMARAG
jgi:hypothetical protein